MEDDLADRSLRSRRARWARRRRKSIEHFAARQGLKMLIGNWKSKDGVASPLPPDAERVAIAD